MTKISTTLQRPLIGAEKIATNFTFQDITIKTVVHAIDGNITVKGLFKGEKYPHSLYLIHAEIYNIKSIEITKYESSVIIEYKTDSDSVKTISINKKGEMEVISDFKCLIEFSMLGKFNTLNGDKLFLTKRIPKTLQMHFYDYSMPKNIYYDINRQILPGDILIENKCGNIYMKYNMFGLMFNVELYKTYGTAIVSNTNNVKKDINWNLGEYLFLGSDGEYHKFNYKYPPTASSLINERYIYNLVIVISNYIISQLLDLKVY